MGSKVTQRGGTPSQLACNSMLSRLPLPASVSLSFSSESLLSSHSDSPALSVPAPACAPAGSSHPFTSVFLSLPLPGHPFLSLFLPPLPSPPSLSVSPSLWLPGICLVSSTNNIWVIDHAGHRGGRGEAVRERSSSCHRDWVEVGTGATLPVLRKGI